MNVGDLVKECVPQEAGDVPERLGLVTQVTLHGYCKVLFDKEELVHYNSLQKVEA